MAPIRVFFSFAPEDSGLRDQLAEHLALLKREGTIQTWHTAELRPGDEVQPAILREIDEAGVILLLISSSYQASDHCFDVQMKRALDRHAKGTAIVLPILLRPCDWESAPYARLPVLPGNRRAVTQWDHPDEAFMAIAAGIREALGARAPAMAAVEPAPVEAGAEKVHPGVEHLFVGRTDEIAELERVLLPGSPMPVAIGALQGMPGVGKSYLADRFAYLHRDRFPGGYAKVSLSPDLPRSVEELAGDLAGKVDLPWGGPNRWEQLRAVL